MYITIALLAHKSRFRYFNSRNTSMNYKLILFQSGLLIRTSAAIINIQTVTVLLRHHRYQHNQFVNTQFKKGQKKRKPVCCLIKNMKCLIFP